MTRTIDTSPAGIAVPGAWRAAWCAVWLTGVFAVGAVAGCDTPAHAEPSAPAASGAAHGPPAATAATAAAATAAAAAPDARTGNPNELVVSYLAAWNERDPARRRALVAKTWTDAGSYVDAHRHGEGHAAIDAMIRTAQDRFPGYQLRLISSIEAHHGFVRFSWSAGGIPGAPLYLAGTDIFTVAGDGRLQSVVGFVDAAPAPIGR